jgi:hypothetical protein
MPVEILIPDEATKYLNGPAVIELQSLMKRYSDDLLAESSRLEATTKTSAGSPEITSSMIKDADLLLRRGYRRPKKKWYQILTQVCAPLFGVITGLLGTKENIKDPGMMIWFIICLIITILSTVITVVKD